MQPALHQREACCISHEYKSRSLWLVTFRSTKIHRTNQIARHEIKIYYAVTDLSMLTFNRRSNFCVPNLRLPKYLCAFGEVTNQNFRRASFSQAAIGINFNHQHLRPPLVDVYFYNFVIMINEPALSRSSSTHASSDKHLWV